MNEPGEEQDLIKFINEQLEKPLENPDDDLGVTLPKDDRRDRPFFLKNGLRVEEIPADGRIEAYDEKGIVKEVHYTDGRRPWVRRAYPRPPYRCLCGATFQDIPTYMAHRHETGSLWVPL